MPNAENSSFIFTVCQIGAEKTLKEEVARNHSDLRFSYSRPGFLTFKAVGPQKLTPDFALKSIFARTYGISLGKLDLKNVTEKAKALLENPIQKIRLHIWERDRFGPGEEPKKQERQENPEGVKQFTELKNTLFKTVRNLEPDLFYEETLPKSGDLVLDLIWVEDEEWWLGCHQHGPLHSPYPGGNPEIQMHPDAPSRAYLKLEEALLWSNAPILKDDVAVEIGSAPGGSTFALLNRGLKLVGIDPADMHPIFRRNFREQFKHIQRPVSSVLREELPDSVQWILLDMNVSPQFSLFAVDRLVTRMEDSLLGVLLTIKLNDWKMASDIPHMLEHIRAMGMTRVRATQLSQNRQEFFAYGLTPKGVRRLAICRK